MNRVRPVIDNGIRLDTSTG